MQATSIDKTRPGRRRRRWAVRILLAPLMLYALWLAALFAMQDFLVFPGVMRTSPGADAVVDPVIEQVTLVAQNGDQVVAWFQPGAARSAASPGPAVISFGGNGDLVDGRWPANRPFLERGLSVLAVEYRGYGRSEGWPSADKLRGDALMFYDWLAARPEVDAERIIAYGHSLGGGVAIALANQRPVAALIAEATFKNTRERTAKFLAPEWLLRHRFPSDQIVPKLDIPILLMHGRNDWRTPIDDSRRLLALAKQGRLVELDCGHSNFKADWAAVDAWLAEAGFAE